jgi:hypothetical protein
MLENRHGSHRDRRKSRDFVSCQVTGVGLIEVTVIILTKVSRLCQLSSHMRGSNGSHRDNFGESLETLSAVESLSCVSFLNP